MRKERKQAIDKAAGEVAHYSETFLNREDAPINPSTAPFPKSYGRRERKVAREAADRAVAVYDMARPIDELIDLLAFRMASEKPYGSVLITQSGVPQVSKTSPAVKFEIRCPRESLAKIQQEAQQSLDRMAQRRA